MKIENNTNFDTRDLQRFFRAGLKAMGAELTKKIEVSYHAGNLVYCRAALPREWELQGGWIRMLLPKERELEDGDLKSFALTFEHEVAHSLGLKHADMDEATRHCRGEMPEWAASLPLNRNAAVVAKEMEATQPKPRADVIEEREQKAIAMAERWEKKVSAAQRRLAKWRRKVRYYAKRRATAAAPKS